jgi:hypothetical protein
MPSATTDQLALDELSPLTHLGRGVGVLRELVEQEQAALASVDSTSERVDRAGVERRRDRNVRPGCRAEQALRKTGGRTDRAPSRDLRSGLRLLRSRDGISRRKLGLQPGELGLLAVGATGWLAHAAAGGNLLEDVRRLVHLYSPP